MMGTGPLPAAEPDQLPGWDYLRDRSAGQLDQSQALLARYDQAALEITAGQCSPDLARRVTLLTQAFREHRTEAGELAAQLSRLTYEDALAGAYDQMVLTATYEAGRAAGRAEAAARRQQRTAHRKTSRFIKVIEGGGAAGIAAAMLIRMWRHKVTLAAAAAAFTAGVGGGAAVTQASKPPPPPAVSAGPASGAQVPDAAAPIPSLPPELAARITPPRGRHGDKDAAGTAAAASLPIAQPPAPAPAPAPSADPSASLPAFAAPPGQLTVSTALIDLTGDTGTTATIVLGTSGGPVDWTATGNGAGTALPSDITLDNASGHLWPGETTKITVSLAASQDGQASVTFELTDQAGDITPVTVNLPQPQPAATGTPSPTDSPAPSPSPSGS